MNHQDVSGGHDESVGKADALEAMTLASRLWILNSWITISSGFAYNKATMSLARTSEK
jgi:hypothetical protein